MLASYQRCQRCRSRCRSVRTMSPGCRCWRIPQDSVICESRARTLSHLSSAALALHSLTWLLWWRFRLGRQLGLFSSIRQAGFPEIKCLEHILFLEILFSVGSDLLIADKNPGRRLWLSYPVIFAVCRALSFTPPRGITWPWEHSILHNTSTHGR